MNATEQDEAARRLMVALDLAGIDVEAPQSRGGNISYLPAHPAVLIAAWQQRLFRVTLREEHGARIVGTIGPDGIVNLKEGGPS